MPTWQISAHPSNLHFSPSSSTKLPNSPSRVGSCVLGASSTPSLHLSVLRLSTLFTYLTYSQSEPCTGKDNLRIPGASRDQVATMKEAGFNVNSPPLLYCPNNSHEIKRHLLLGRKVMTNLDSILKSKDITLPTKVRLVKAMVFPVVMYGCESWTVKKAER